MTAPVALYRHFDAAGSLLYVGQTANPAMRTQVHMSQSHWFCRIARIEIEWFGGRSEAIAAETAAISAEKPAFNHLRVRKTWRREGNPTPVPA